MDIKQLYVDNYRGFHDTHIPLDKVNFFVGENSTGKTSILKIFDLLTSSELWFNGQFRNANVDFSYYGDLAENTHTSKTTIAVSFKGTRNSKSESSFAKLVLQSGKNNQTVIRSLQLSYEDTSIVIENNPTKGLRYMISKDNISQRTFSDWCSDKFDPNNLKAFSEKLAPFEREGPFFLVYTILRSVNKSSSSSFRSPDFLDTFKPFSWIAPIRAKPQQTYDGNVYEYAADGAHTPYRIRTIFDRKSNKDSRKIISALEKFGQESGLFDSIKSKRYSKEGNAPFAIDIVRGDEIRHITDVGYGVSQVLPIVVAILGGQYINRFEIQQPEVHLHPRAQASLGGLFYDIAESENSTLLVETHSDFIIDRFRQRMSGSKSKNKPDAQVLFFEHTNEGNVAHSIKIDSDGSYPIVQPDSFRRFFVNEELKNITI